MSTEGFRTCSGCRVMKPVIDFCGKQRECRECRKITAKGYRDRNIQKLRDYQSQYWQKLKLEVLSHYSQGSPVCSKCNFSDIRALTIDHIFGGGCYHRSSRNLLGKRFYRWLKQQNFPDNYQVLCMNCQFIKRQENKEWRIE